MKNVQLKTLLSRSSLCEEDIYNVCTIFWALSEEKQNHILWNWEKYLEKIAYEKQKLNAEYWNEIFETLSQANTLLDSAIEKFKEQEKQKIKTKEIAKEELESAMTYDSIIKMEEIKKISKKI